MNLKVYDPQYSKTVFRIAFVVCAYCEKSTTARSDCTSFSSQDNHYPAEKIWESRAEILKIYWFLSNAENSWLDVGYNIVHIDDCWAVKERNNKTGKIDPDPERLVIITVVSLLSWTLDFHTVWKPLGTISTSWGFSLEFMVIWGPIHAVAIRDRWATRIGLDFSEIFETKVVTQNQETPYF